MPIGVARLNALLSDSSILKCRMVVAAMQLPAPDYSALTSFMPATPLLAPGQLRFLPPSPSHSGNTTLNAASMDSRTASGTLTSSLTAVGGSGATGGITPPLPGNHQHAYAAAAAAASQHAAMAANGGGLPGLGHLGQPPGGGGLHARLSAAAGGMPGGGAGNVGLGGLSGMGLSNGYNFDRYTCILGL